MRKTSPRTTNLLVLDNRDSFVFNLVEEFRCRGVEVETLRSDLPLSALQTRLAECQPELVLLSPGPGRPEEAGVMVEWLKTEPETPVLGICLGHQAMAVAAGGEVDRAPRPVHGQKSVIDCQPDEPLFKRFGTIPDGGMTIVAARYHSLVVTRLPDSMRVIATTMDQGQRLVMGMRHRDLCRIGLQFHPESILTPRGGELLWNFYREARRYRRKRIGARVASVGGPREKKT